MIFREDEWVGNKWASIEIEPVDAAYFLPVLWHLSNFYSFPLPPVIDGIDCYITDFELLNSNVAMHLDVWSFSIAFEKTAVRDEVLAALRALPDLYFGA